MWYAIIVIIQSLIWYKRINVSKCALPPLLQHPVNLKPGSSGSTQRHSTTAPWNRNLSRDMFKSAYIIFQPCALYRSSNWVTALVQVFSFLVRSTRAVVEEKKLWSLDCSHEVQAQQCCQHQGVFGAWSGEHNLFAGVWRKAASLPRRTAGPSITLCTRLHLHLFNPPQPFSHRHLLHQVDHLYLVCHLLEQDVEEEEKHISFFNIAKDMLNSKLALPVKGLFINDVITFGGYPDPPIPLVIMSSFDYPAPFVRVNGEENWSAT